MSASATTSISPRVAPGPDLPSTFTPLGPVGASGPAANGAPATPPPEEPGPKAAPKREDNAIRRVPLWIFVFGSTTFIAALILSFVLHGGVFSYAKWVAMPPLRDSGEFALNARIINLMVVELPPEEEDKPEEIVEPEPTPPEEPKVSDAIEPEEEPPVVEPPPPEPIADLGHGLEGMGDGGIDLGASGPGGGGLGAGSGSRGNAEGEKIEPTRPAPRERPSALRLEDTSVPPQPRVQEPALGYPREFREAGIEGRVVVQCIITERGDVRACRHKSGPKELGEYAISIVRNWKFEPGKDHRGRAVPVAYTFRFPFRLR